MTSVLEAVGTASRPKGLCDPERLRPCADVSDGDASAPQGPADPFIVQENVFTVTLLPHGGFHTAAAAAAVCSARKEPGLTSHPAFVLPL